MRCIIFLVLITYFFTNNLYPHALHYKKIKLLKYSIFFNNDLVGEHTFNFDIKDNKFFVKENGFFKITKFGVDLINYKTESQSIYNGNQLIKFVSKTIQNDKKKYAYINLSNQHLNIDGSSFRGKTDQNTPLSSFWNHDILTKNKQISSISGSLNDYTVKFLGKKTIKIKNKIYEANNFHIFSNDNKKMKDKKINIKLWYSEIDYLWLKASYEKIGTWEYRLEDVKY